MQRSCICALPDAKRFYEKSSAEMRIFMDNDFWNNPLLANMAPEKLQFLMNFASKEKPTNIREMMPFLLSSMSSAKSNNIQFSDPETELLVTLLKQNMSDADAEKADRIIQLVKERKQHK